MSEEPGSSDGLVAHRCGLVPAPQSFELLAHPPHQAGVDAFQERIEGRLVEGPSVSHPSPNDRVDEPSGICFGQADFYGSTHLITADCMSVYGTISQQ